MWLLWFFYVRLSCLFGCLCLMFMLLFGVCCLVVGVGVVYSLDLVLVLFYDDASV